MICIEPFLVDLIPVVVEVMGDAYPELRDRASLIASIIGNEEATFYTSLPRGLKVCSARRDAS
jgi:alanyl-tRNA synthetase